jgi:hypothetical protein
MSALHPASATLPKGFRYDAINPRTPEPTAPGDEEIHLASPPRPRLRLKRRNVSSHLQPPTQQFLASVAAADVPIPSVEEPQFATRDEEMIDGLPEIRLHDDYDDLDVYQRLHARTFSPPKTPAGDSMPSIPVTKYPNWSIDSSWSGSDLESSPEYESSRPSTAFSTQTTSSLFSRFSHPSEDGECFSPELDSGDFQMPDSGMAVDGLERRRPRRAPWTKAMSSHLWSTYLLYLQDPKVTPVRLGKSCIPPEGVCARVAREARRSWRGAKQTNATTRSGSSTPTAESSKPFMEWPHTCAATRARLRELCRMKASSKQGRSTYISQSPPPFNKAAHRRWNRRSTPARSPSIFSAQDMAMSLTLSTSEAMQPQGPLAQLASSQPASLLDTLVATDPFHDSSALPVPDDATAVGRARLGSPFLAKSYGPSSSSSLGESLHVRRHSHTVGPRKLLSPVRLTRSRSKTGPQKRRSFKGLEDPPRKRPSLAAALWGPPPEAEGQVHKDETEVPFSSTESLAGDSLFVPRTPGGDLFPANNVMAQDDITSLVAGSPPPAPASIPARLGSPFSSSHTSHSFPNRLSQPINFNLSALRRPFATVQQTTDSSAETAPARSSLASRLAYLDQRLRELRSRNITRRRSQSPL